MHAAAALVRRLLSIFLQEVYTNAAYLSAQETSQIKGPRIQTENGDRQWPEGSLSPPRQGQKSDLRLKPGPVPL